MSELASYRTVLEEFFAAGLHALLSGFVRDNMARFTPPNPDAPEEQSHGIPTPLNVLLGLGTWCTHFESTWKSAQP